MPSGCSEEYIVFAQRLADMTGNIIKCYFRKPITIETKPNGSPVTVADREAEEVIRETIARTYPEHGIIGEEHGSTNPQAELTWVLDPIDGTASFITGKPIFGTLISLYRRNVPLLGIIDQPITGERWLGIAQNETTLNGRPVKSRTNVDLANAYLDATDPDMFSKYPEKIFWQLANAVGKIRWGSDCYAYAMLATGHVDLVCESGMKFYDFAALVPIIEGSGGTVTDWKGNALSINSNGTVLAAGSPELHREALNILKRS